MRRDIIFAIVAAAAVGLAGCHKMEQLYTPAEGDIEWGDTTTTIEEGVSTTPSTGDEGDDGTGGGGPHISGAQATTTVLSSVVTKIYDVTSSPETLKGTVTTTYGYSGDDRLESIETEAGVRHLKTTVTYDAEGRIDSLNTMDIAKGETKSKAVMEYGTDGNLKHFDQSSWDTSVSPTVLKKHIRIDYSYDASDPLLRKAESFDMMLPPPEPMIGSEVVHFASENMLKEYEVKEILPSIDVESEWAVDVSDGRMNKIDGEAKVAMVPRYVKKTGFIYTPGDGIPEKVFRKDVSQPPLPAETITYLASDSVYDRDNLMHEVVLKELNGAPQIRFERDFTYKLMNGTLQMPPAITMPTEVFYPGRVTLLYADKPILYMFYPFEHIDSY